MFLGELLLPHRKLENDVDVGSRRGTKGRKNVFVTHVMSD